MLVCTRHNYVSLFESRHDNITPGVYNGIRSTVVLRLAASAYYVAHGMDIAFAMQTE
jgi:hypothetical protein